MMLREQQVLINMQSKSQVGRDKIIENVIHEVRGVCFLVGDENRLIMRSRGSRNSSGYLTRPKISKAWTTSTPSQI